MEKEGLGGGELRCLFLFVFVMIVGVIVAVGVDVIVRRVVIAVVAALVIFLADVDSLADDGRRQLTVAGAGSRAIAIWSCCSVRLC